MSMVFMDGCDHYDQNSTIELKWTVNNGCTSLPGGRNGRCISIGAGFVGKTLQYSQGWVVGFAANFQTTVGWGGEAQLYEVFHAGDTRLGWISVETDATITLHAGNQVIGNSGMGPDGSTFSFHPVSWYYIEIKTNLGSSSEGTVLVDIVVRVNGVIVVSGSGDSLIPINTLLLNVPSANFHRFSAGGVVDGTMLLDDLGIATTIGGSVTDFFGDIKLGALFPRQDEQTDWVPTPSGPSFSCVNEPFPDGDTSYISSFTPGEQDNFDWQPVSTFIGTIVAVHYGVYARKDDEGSRSFQLTCNGLNVGPVFSPGDTYVYYFFCMDEDPTTGVPWTQDGFNATTFGVNLIS